jgi:alkanesulfonate monooxygenase
MKLQRYIDLGIRAFILSGYYLDECDLFAKHVLPRITVKLNEAQGRLPEGDTGDTVD